jgi:hypothetical protein
VQSDRGSLDRSIGHARLIVVAEGDQRDDKNRR